MRQSLGGRRPGLARALTTHKLMPHNSVVTQKPLKMSSCCADVPAMHTHICTCPCLHVCAWARKSVCEGASTCVRCEVRQRAHFYDALLPCLQTHVSSSSKATSRVSDAGGSSAAEESCDEAERVQQPSTFMLRSSLPGNMQHGREGFLMSTEYDCPQAPPARQDSQVSGLL